MINVQYLFKASITTLLMLILYFFMFLQGDYFLCLVLFTLLCFLSTFPFDKKTPITHPRIVFGVFFYLYNTFYYYFIILRGDYDSVLIIDSLKYSSTAILCFYIVIVICDFIYRPVRHTVKISKVRYVLSLRIIYVSFFLVSFLICSYAATLGLSKRDLQESIGYLASIAQFSTLYLVALTLVIIYPSRANIYKHRLIILSTLSILMLYYFVAGERGDLFRFGICLFLIYYEGQNKRPVSKLYLLVILGVFVLPITQAFKSVLMGGSGEYTYALGDLFFGEFSSSSRNLYLISKYGSMEGNEFMLFTDLIRALVPFSSLMNIESSVYWYHTVYRPNFNFGSDVGWGLGLVPQGVLLGGHFGVLILFSVLSLLTFYLYSKREKSEYYYVFYLMYLTTLIYCLRADFANLLSVSFKIVLFLFLLVHLSHFLLRKKT